MTMKRAFTLVELLVVIGIMGFMGTVSVGGYRAMRRGMEERGVVQNVNQFIRSAYQRAQIERQPVAVYFWNETLRGSGDMANVVVVGKAIAVRRTSRITAVIGKYLYDEFGDLSFSRLILDTDNDDETTDSDQASDDRTSLYKINGNEGAKAQRSEISSVTVRKKISDPLVMEGASMQDFYAYAFSLADANGVSWKPGDAYGFQFAEITLPHGFAFGSSFSRSTSNPVSGETAMMFTPGGNSGSGATGGINGKATIDVCSLRPDKSGNVVASKVASTQNPTESLKE